MKKRDTTPQAQIGNPIYLWAKQNPVTPQIRIRMSNADVYLLSWLLLASEHCDRTTGLQPVNLQPILIHQFILLFFLMLFLLIIDHKCQADTFCWKIGATVG